MRQSSVRTLASSRVSKSWPFKSSSRSRPLKLSAQAFLPRRVRVGELDVDAAELGELFVTGHLAALNPR
jgi:hypothetical protein